MALRSGHIHDDRRGKDDQGRTSAAAGTKVPTPLRCAVVPSGAGDTSMYPASSAALCRQGANVPDFEDDGRWCPRRVRGSLTGMDADTVRTVVETAEQAPSVHNSQPWHFLAAGDRIDVRADRGRWLRQIDPTGRQLHISCGAATEFARLAVRALGRDCTVDAGPLGEDPELLARLTAGLPRPPTETERPPAHRHRIQVDGAHALRRHTRTVKRPGTPARRGRRARLLAAPGRRTARARRAAGPARPGRGPGAGRSRLPGRVDAVAPRRPARTRRRPGRRITAVAPRAGRRHAAARLRWRRQRAVPG